MQLSTILTTVLKFFASSPDLCADVYVDANGEPYTDAIGQTLSRYCAWTGPDAPVLDAKVCCAIDGDVASCVFPDARGRCRFGSSYSCEYGEAVGRGVVCYQPFPSACDFGFCVQFPEVPPPTQADLACCSPGVCLPIETSQMDTCDGNGGTVVWCFNGNTNSDGSITCYD